MMKTAMKPNGRAKSNTNGRISRLTILNKKAAANPSMSSSRPVEPLRKLMPEKMSAVSRRERLSMNQTAKKRAIDRMREVNVPIQWSFIIRDAAVNERAVN